MTTVALFDPVRDRLALVEAKLREPGPNESEALRAATNHLLSSGGKRVRPALGLLTGSMLGSDMERVIAAAAACEMLHTATLVHDDLIDGSLLRRGIPTLNARWTASSTVLAGDYLFARAADFAAQTQSVRLMSEFARTLMIIVNGEINQQFRGRGHASREDYYSRIYAKTASLFELSTKSAAMLSDEDESIIDGMAAYGREVGMAFQIVDDVLDFAGNEAHVGKPVGSDLRQGLVTLPALYYLDSHPDDPDLMALLNGRSGDAALVSRVVRSVQNSGAINAALAEARTYVERAQAALSRMPDVEERHALMDLSEFFLQRDL